MQGAREGTNQNGVFSMTRALRVKSRCPLRPPLRLVSSPGVGIVTIHRISFNHKDMQEWPQSIECHLTIDDMQELQWLCILQLHLWPERDGNMPAALADLWAAVSPLKWHIHTDGIAAIDHASF
jgi:hypothetical protein